LRRLGFQVESGGIFRGIGDLQDGRPVTIDKECLVAFALGSSRDSLNAEQLVRDACRILRSEARRLGRQNGVDGGA